MNSELKGLNKKKTLEYIVNASNFTMNDYEVLVTKVNNNAEYLIPLIKFKFNLDVNISLLKNANYYWKQALIQYLDFNPEYLSEYMNIIDDNILTHIIFYKKPVIVEQDKLILLLDNNYIKSFYCVLENNTIIITDELFNIIKNSGVRLSNISLQLVFNTRELLFNFIKHYKYFTNNIILRNSHLFNNKDFFEEILDILVKNNIKYSLDSKLVVGKFEKEILKILLHGERINLRDISKKLLKYTDLWKYCNFSKCILNYHIRNILNDIDYSKSVEKILSKILKNLSNNTNLIFGNTNRYEPYVISYILITSNNFELKILDDMHKSIIAYITQIQQYRANSNVTTRTISILREIDILILEKQVKIVEDKNKKEQEFKMIHNNELPVLHDL